MALSDTGLVFRYGLSESSFTQFDDAGTKIDADSAQRSKDAGEAAAVLKDLQVKALAAAEERDAAEKARDAAKAELASVTAKLETTRSQIARMLG